VAWVLLGPLLILGIYALVYLEIFRLQPPGFSKEHYVFYIFAGLVPFLVTAEAISNAVGSVSANKSVLMNTVFPIDLVPVKAVLMSVGTMVVGMAIVVGGTAATGSIGLTVLLLPIVVALHFMALIGVAWVISLLNVVFRDLQSLIAALLLILLIASPIAYTPTMVPPGLRPLLDLNPFSYFVRAYQQILVVGTVPGPWLLAGLLVLSGVAFLSGSWLFHRAKRVIVDYV
jgi:lipopolysaccharide transport system permease protein